MNSVNFHEIITPPIMKRNGTSIVARWTTSIIVLLKRSLVASVQVAVRNRCKVLLKMRSGNIAYRTVLAVGIMMSCYHDSRASGLSKCNKYMNTACRENKLEDYVASRVDAGTREEKPPVTKFLDDVLGERLFNTTMNFIVPGAKVTLARHTDEGPADHLALQAFFGLFWASAWFATIVIPASVLYFKPLGLGRSYKNDGNEFKIQWHLNPKMIDAIGLDWRTCLQKTVCESHRYSGARGDIGNVFETLFPIEEKSKLDQDENWLVAAAKHGAIGHNCGNIYKCFFDVLDVMSYLTNGIDMSFNQ